MGIIVDGFHVHPVAVQMAWSVKGPDQLVLVTDSMAAMGMGSGTFGLGSVDVKNSETGPRNQAGDLAGSALSYDEAVRNFIAITRCSPVDAIAVSSRNPARVISDPSRGSMVVGARSDVVLVDSDFSVKVALVGGNVAYTAPGVVVVSTESEGTGS